MINPDNMQKAFKTAKRIAITVVICIPFLIVFAYLTRNVITSSGLQIFLFVLIMGIAVAVVETVVYLKQKHKKDNPEIEQDKTDVFK